MYYFNTGYYNLTYKYINTKQLSNINYLLLARWVLPAINNKSNYKLSSAHLPIE